MFSAENFLKIVIIVHIERETGSVSSFICFYLFILVLVISKCNFQNYHIYILIGK